MFTTNIILHIGEFSGDESSTALLNKITYKRIHFKRQNKYYKTYHLGIFSIRPFANLSLLYDYNVFTTISDFIEYLLKELSKCKTNKNNIVYKIPIEDRKLILCGKTLEKSKPFHKLVKKIYQHPRIHFV